MLNQHYEGNHVKDSLTLTIYINMKKELKILLEMVITKARLKKYQMKTLKEHFNECYNIFKSNMLSGIN